MLFQAGSTEPQSITFFANNNNLYLATANSASNDVTIFTVHNDTLADGRSYLLPQNTHESPVYCFFIKWQLSRGS